MLFRSLSLSLSLSLSVPLSLSFSLSIYLSFSLPFPLSLSLSLYLSLSLSLSLSLCPPLHLTLSIYLSIYLTNTHSYTNAVLFLCSFRNVLTSIQFITQAQSISLIVTQARTFLENHPGGLILLGAYNIGTFVTLCYLYYSCL